MQPVFDKWFFSNTFYSTTSHQSLFRNDYGINMKQFSFKIQMFSLFHGLQTVYWLFLSTSTCIKTWISQYITNCYTVTCLWACLNMASFIFDSATNSTGSFRAQLEEFYDTSVQKHSAVWNRRAELCIDMWIALALVLCTASNAGAKVDHLYSNLVYICPPIKRLKSTQICTTRITVFSIL